MTKFTYLLTDSLRILKCHKLIAFLLVLQNVLCLSLIGIVSDQYDQTKDHIEQYQNNILSKQYYQMSEHFDDSFFISFMENDYKFKNLVAFKNEMDREFNYVIATEQPISIREVAIPEVCLDGYESGNADHAIAADQDGVQFSAVKSLQVSPNFFDEFNIKPQQGQLWNDVDFKYVKGQTVPIVLGAGYSDFFNIGDTFEGDYLDESISFRVTAILPANASWSAGGSIQYMDRYMILPSFTVDENDTDSSSKKRLLQQLCGMIISDDPVAAVTQKAAEIAASHDIPFHSNGIRILDPNEKVDVMAMYSTMTEGVKEQFALLLLVLILFVIFSLSITVNGFIRSHHYEFGVKLLNGASISDIAVQILMILILIMGTSAVISSLILLLNGTFSWYLCLIPIFIVLISAPFPIFHIRSIDINTIIGGRE